MTFRIAALLLLLLQGDEDGRRLYRDGILPSGQPLRGIVQGGVPLEGAAASCASCHRRSGYGSVEGTTVVPPITATALFGSDPAHRADLFRKLFQEDLSARAWASVRDPRTRPPYTEATLAATLRDGRDPTGRELDPLMPRYRLDPEAMAELVTYLKTLSFAPDPGVDDDAIHFATVVTEGVDPNRRKALLDVLEAYVRWKDADVARRLQRPWPPAGEEEAFSGGYRRWQLHVWELTGPAATWPAQLEARYRERPVFAVLGGLGEGDWSPVHTFCERTGVPCLFPETDLPVTAPSGDWTVYLSPGLAVEAQTVARHLRDVQGEIVQVYRDSEAGRAAAQALRKALAGSLEDRAFAPGPAFWTDLLGKRQPAALVLWLSGEDLASLPATPGALSRIYLSSTLLGEDLSRLSEPWRDRALLTWRWSLPGKAGPHAYRVRAWLRARNIAPGPERLQLDTWLTLSLADTALMHLADRFSRDLFLETVERETERMPNPGVYPRLSLGPGQRFASKGCYLVRLTPEGVEAVGDWLVP